MVLSDRTIRQEIDAGRIVIEPFDPDLVQPSSVDVRVDRRFRVFHNARYPYIDVRQPMDDLTELVEVGDDEPFILHPGEFVLGQTFERVTLPDDLVARLEGKALSVDTAVPTPSGWTTMGDLSVGDFVFSPSGDPVRVIAASPVMTDRDCYELTFSDGTGVVADGSHQWAVHTSDDRRRGRTRIVTTRELEGRERKNREFRFRVFQTKPVRYERQMLPIDPYVLGVWVGDGTATKAEVTTVDEPILQELEMAGYAVRPASGPIAYRVGGVGHTRDPATGRYTRNGSLSSALRNLGLLGRKRIPTEYLEASVEQRMALLEGLMDTDGYVDECGRCDITTIDRNLAEQYRELVASLGFRPVVAQKTATLYGKVCGERYEVTFTPPTPVFRLPRKRARQDITRRRHHPSRAIARVRAVRRVPVRCIEVEAADGLFLITRSFIPTHNSSLGRLGLLIHSTAGFVDSGFSGNLTLELSNVANLPITIYHGMPIGQISFMRMDGPVERP